MTTQHCGIECNDDAICLKAGRDADGLRVNRPSRRIVIRDNTVRATIHTEDGSQVVLKESRGVTGLAK